MTATTFAELGVSDVVVGQLEARGITESFPIQAATIKAALGGRDICGKAPTGSGKTLAFGIPVVDLVEKGKNWQPKALILAPTRELATQIKEELEPLARANDRSIVTVFGGTNIERDIRRLEKGVDILVACPGRLEDLISRRCCELRNVNMVVVDEADRMADMGFLPSVKRLLDQTSDDRHTLLFSATLDGDVDMLIKRYQNNPLTFEVEEQVGDIGDVDHSWYLIQPNDRIASAVRILRSYESSIVFCRTRRGCDRVAKVLAGKGLSAVAIHGDRSQGQRERALSDFTAGKAQVLVATDVAARGIHVDNVALVMHYDPAGSDKDYIHRSGRTGRAGQDGRVISMIVDEKKKIARQLQKDLGLKPGFDDYDVDVAALPPVVERPTIKDRPKSTEPKQQGKNQGNNGGKNKDQGSGKNSGRGRDSGPNRGGRDDARDQRGGRDEGNRRSRGPKKRDRGGRRDTSGRNSGDSRGGRNDGGRDSSKRRGDDDRSDSRPPRRRRSPGSNDWYPKGYFADDDGDRRPSRGPRKGSSSSRSDSNTRGDRDSDETTDGQRQERPAGGRNTTKRKNRSTKGRHADKTGNKNKGKRRKPRR